MERSHREKRFQLETSRDQLRLTRLMDFDLFMQFHFDLCISFGYVLRADFFTMFEVMDTFMVIDGRF